MSRFAGWNSNDFVKSRLQAQLYHARKRRLGRLSGGVTPTPQFQTDSSVSALNSEGWRAIYSSPSTFDPVGDPKYVVARRNGFDASGSPTTYDDPLLIMSRIRQPFPNQTTLETDEVALSDFVFSGDTIVENGTVVTNNSTRSYFKPQAMWLNPDLQIEKTSTFVAKLAVIHAMARNGRPVAAVKFIASDGVNSDVEVVVSSMSLETYSNGSGFSVPHFQASIDLSTLDPGVVTIDAIIYPWVGNAFTVSTDADTYPSPNLTTLRILNDRDDSFGTTYAYVSTTGNDGTGVASASPTTAQASSFLTVAAAAAAIQSFNNSNYSRNDASSGIVRLEAGTFTHSNFSSVVVGDFPITIEGVSRSTSIYQDAGSSVSNGCPDKLRFKNITLKRNASGNVIFIDSGAGSGSSNCVIFEDVTFDDGGFGTSWGAYVYRVGRTYLVGCDGDNIGIADAFSTVFKSVVGIGSLNVGSSRTYHLAGCSGITFSNPSSNANSPDAVGNFCGWSFLSQPNNGSRALYINKVIDDRGVGVVGSIFENYGGDTGPCFWINADGNTDAADNVNVISCTVVGSRTNFCYQDTGTVRIDKIGRTRFCIHREYNSKTDLFPTENENRIGNWSTIYKVGYYGNVYIKGGNNGDSFGTGVWLGQIGDLGNVVGTDASPVVVDFVDDRSFDGAATGGGDYSLGVSTEVPLIEDSLIPFSHDLYGNPLSSGSARSGAVQ